MTFNGWVLLTVMPQWMAATLAIVLMCALVASAADIPLHPLDGVVMVGPSCVGAQPEGALCKAPMAGVEVRLSDADGRTAASTTTDAAGMFRMRAPPGHYRLHVILGPAKVPRCPALDIALPLANTGRVELECDSGMR
jgi:hypothetical protein